MNEISIPDCVTKIWDYAFYECSMVKLVSVPVSVTQIGKRVFYGCSTLQGVVIPDDVTTINDYLFYNCTYLVNITIPDTPGEPVRENEGDHGAHELVTYCEICGEELSREAVEGYLPGDINGDGEVDNKDLTRLFRYLSDYDVEVVEAALDVNGDGEVNNKDLTRLFRYLSHWDVEIY